MVAIKDIKDLIYEKDSLQLSFLTLNKEEKAKELDEKIKESISLGLKNKDFTSLDLVAHGIVEYK